MDKIDEIVQVYKEYLELREEVGLLTFHEGDGIHLKDEYFREVFDEYDVKDRWYRLGVTK